MRQPQVLVYERDGRLARLLENTRTSHGWSSHWTVREPRRPESCLKLLRRGGPAVLVLHVGSKLDQELALLERVHWLRPDTAVIVVGDAANEALANLAWDLGASGVLFPPQSRDLLPAIVAHWLQSSAAETATPTPEAEEDAAAEDDDA